nr:MAG TPA: hypothetical protein [Caudoviricetes sp.]
MPFCQFANVIYSCTLAGCQNKLINKLKTR